MSRSFRLPLYLFFFGVLSFYAAVFRSPVKEEYQPAQVLGTQTGLALFVEPEDGREPIINKIKTAQKEVLVEVYLLSDPEIIQAVAEAKGRGVVVKVLLEEHPFGGGSLNQKSQEQLRSQEVGVAWANPAFALTHEKAVVIDRRVVCILNMNLTKTAFSKNREYNVCDENQEEVAETVAIFTADWKRQGYSPRAANLVVAPDNARGKLTVLISSAKSQLDIEMEVLEDKQMVELIAERAKRIDVRVVVPEPAKIETNKKALEKLFKNGVKVRALAFPYPHAKLILVDNDRAYVGSINLSSQSLEKNRELGIIISQKDIIGRLADVFGQDWEQADSLEELL